MLTSQYNSQCKIAMSTKAFDKIRTYVYVETLLRHISRSGVHQLDKILKKIIFSKILFSLELSKFCKSFF